MQELDRDVTDASEVGKAARLAAEKMLKKPVVSSQNYLKTGKRPQFVEAPKSEDPSAEQLSLLTIVDVDSPDGKR